MVMSPRYVITACSSACVDGETYESVACAAGVDRTCSSELSNIGGGRRVIWMAGLMAGKL